MIYNRQKKKPHHLDFSVKFSFKCENAKCDKLHNFDLISVNLECVVDEYLCFPQAETETSLSSVNRNFEALIQLDCLCEISSMLYNCKVLKRFIFVM